MKSGISEVIQHPVIVARMFSEPVDRTDRKQGLNGRITDFLLRHHDVNLVAPTEFRQKFGAITADAAWSRWKWRYIRQLWAPAGSDSYSAMLSLSAPLYQSGKRPPGALIPGETLRLLKPVERQRPTKIVVCKRLR